MRSIALATAITIALGQLPPGRPQVAPVSPRALVDLLPAMDGWQVKVATGDVATAPFVSSTAVAIYAKDDMRVHVTLTDSAFNDVLLAPHVMFLATGDVKETPEGREKAVKVNGQPGWETWDRSELSGELNALVGRRFLVRIEGTGIDAITPLYEFALKIDMNRLAALK